MLDKDSLCISQQNDDVELGNNPVNIAPHRKSISSTPSTRENLISQ
jgi:hypothetical protein